MNKSEVKKGDYIYCEYYDEISSAIIKVSNDGSFYSTPGVTMYSIKESGYFGNTNKWSCDKNIRLATPEEKHWLNECIRLNKFITKEEAMTTFIPEFILPTKWYIDIKKINNDDVKILDLFLHSHLKHYEGYKTTWEIIKRPSEDAFLHYPQIPNSGCHTHYRKHDDYTEITFEQFRKYVLKENITISPIKLAETAHKLYTMEEVQLALNKEYDKLDVEDIINVIKKIK